LLIRVHTRKNKGRIKKKTVTRFLLLKFKSTPVVDRLGKSQSEFFAVDIKRF